MSSLELKSSPLLSSLRRSAGLKLILVCGLVLLMAIPAMFIGVISLERSSAATEVVEDVSRLYGGAQTIIGPIMSVPYMTKQDDGTIVTGHYILYPDIGKIDFSAVDVEVKSKSLYKVPIYTARGVISARFNEPLTRLAESGLDLQTNKARLIISVTDLRGLKQDIRLSGPRYKGRLFEPSPEEAAVKTGTPAVYDYDNAGNRRIIRPAVTGRQHYPLPQFGRWMQVPIGDFLSKGEELSVSVDLTVSGAQLLSVPPFAKSTDVTMVSNWADPGFQGEFTPIDRKITEAGFTADWSMPYLSRGIIGQGTSNRVLQTLAQNVVRVKFVSTDNPYQTVNRALKYSVLFIGLVFLAYFLFEVIVGTPVHPAQYILIGLAQAIFYLLLLAFSERIGFTLAFTIAASLTILITSAYAGAVFGGRAYIWKAGGVFVAVYGVLYVLMRIEDFALMIGALASFTAIAATMYLTRNMNWYSGAQTVS